MECVASLPRPPKQRQRFPVDAGSCATHSRIDPAPATRQRSTSGSDGLPSKRAALGDIASAGRTRLAAQRQQHIVGQQSNINQPLPPFPESRLRELLPSPQGCRSQASPRPPEARSPAEASSCSLRPHGARCGKEGVKTVPPSAHHRPANALMPLTGSPRPSPSPHSTSRAPMPRNRSLPPLGQKQQPTSKGNIMGNRPISAPASPPVQPLPQRERRVSFHNDGRLDQRLVFGGFIGK